MTAGLTIRPATPADAAGITAVHCSHVRVWRRGGRGEVVPYDTLSPYEQWLHGGPWMNVETCAAYLERWLRAGHRALVALKGETVVGEAEFVEDDEPWPYGHVLHVSLLFVHADYTGQGVGRALVEAGAELARALGCEAMTTQPEPEAEKFYRRVGFEPWLWLREWQSPTRERLLPDEPVRDDRAPYPWGSGLALRVGRYQTGRHMWHELADRPLPELARLPWGRWRARLPGGETVWLGLRAQPLAPSQADGFVWASPQADLRPAVETLQALAARLDFAYVDLLLEEPEGREIAAALGLEFQTDVTFWRREL